ncbi:MAG: SCO family protein [Hyphomicrobiales bacterium]|nr:SCO family protein [Hyphomicrobiales bacterium]
MSGRRGPPRLAIYTAFAALAAALVITAIAVFTLSRPGGIGTVISSGEAQVGGPFTMTDENGGPVTEKSLLGKPSILFFGFTYCPEVCPTTLYDMSAVLEKMGDDADRINAVFISVDPERDTPQAMKDYLQAFNPHIRGFTGTPEETREIAKAYRVYYRKVPLEGGDYTVDHTALVYLFDAEGKFVSPLNLKQAPEKAAAPIRALLGES